MILAAFSQREVEVVQIALQPSARHFKGDGPPVSPTGFFDLSTKISVEANRPVVFMAGEHEQA